MAGGFLNGLVTFGSNGDRNRARNAINNWVNNWNSTHPTAAFVGSVSDTTYLYPADDAAHANANARALQLAYTCTDYFGVEEAQRVIAQDINANSYWDIISLGTGLVL